MQRQRHAFGLHNTPGTWQLFIDLTYIHDIFVVTPTFDRCITILEEVLHRLKNAGLTLRRAKCQFYRDELKYLGYAVNRYKLSVNPDKVKIIPPPGIFQRFAAF